MTWKRLSLLLAAICLLQWWRDCNRRAPEAPPEPPPCPKLTQRISPAVAGDPAAPADERPAEPGGVQLYGFTVPAWAAWFAPQRGEDVRSYRDRMLPIAQAAIAPQRARVARSREAFAALAGLDARQLAELDGAARETATAIEEKVLGAAMNGDFSPATFKPMTGVTAAREVLDLVERGNQRFLASLRDDQRAKLATHPFDFGDYLVFSTRWEDVLKIFD